MNGRLVQMTQAAPFFPHAKVLLPPAQVIVPKPSSLQQPLGQVAGPQGPATPPPAPPPEPEPPPVPAAQTPVLQTIAPVHAVQAPPVRPHLAAVGTVMQVLPSQQPLPQVVALQGGAQAPLEQGWPAGQETQLAPDEPQAVSAFPDWQAPVVSLQPWVQTVAAQAAIWHDWPAVQLAQAPPILPQLWLVLPPRQTAVESQQPLQLVELQAPVEPPPTPLPPPAPDPPPDPPPEPTQAPPWHDSFEAQPTHMLAAVPQAKLSLPGWHSLLASQQPAQLDFLQVPRGEPQDGAREIRKPSRAPSAKCRTDIRAGRSTIRSRRSKRRRPVMVRQWRLRSSIST